MGTHTSFLKATFVGTLGAMMVSATNAATRNRGAAVGRLCRGGAALLWLLCLMSGEAVATVLMGPVTNPSNGHLYYLLAPTNWTVAQFEAMRLGGNLTTVNDASENTWIAQTFGHYGGQARNLWIGLGDADRNGLFTWVNGEPLTYTNWAAGEPNRFGGTEFYGTIVNWGTAWNDMPDLPGQIGRAHV